MNNISKSDTVDSKRYLQFLNSLTKVIQKITLNIEPKYLRNICPPWMKYVHNLQHKHVYIEGLVVQSLRITNTIIRKITSKIP